MLVWEKKRKRNTGRRSIAQLWNLYWRWNSGCVLSHFKGQLCIIMYPFKTKYVHVLLNCMYADAFVFIQGENMSIKTKLCLREMFWCSWGRNPIEIFLKNKTAMQNYFFLCVPPHNLLSSFFIHDDLHSLVCQQAERFASRHKTFTASFLNSSCLQASVLCNHFWTLKCAKVRDQDLSQWPRLAKIKQSK